MKFPKIYFRFYSKSFQVSFYTFSCWFFLIAHIVRTIEITSATTNPLSSECGKTWNLGDVKNLSQCGGNKEGKNCWLYWAFQQHRITRQISFRRLSLFIFRKWKIFSKLFCSLHSYNLLIFPQLFEKKFKLWLGFQKKCLNICLVCACAMLSSKFEYRTVNISLGYDNVNAFYFSLLQSEFEYFLSHVTGVVHCYYFSHFS